MLAFLLPPLLTILYITLERSLLEADTDKPGACLSTFFASALALEGIFRLGPGRHYRRLLTQASMSTYTLELLHAHNYAYGNTGVLR